MLEAITKAPSDLRDGPARIVVRRVYKFKLRVTSRSTADKFVALDRDGERMGSIRRSPGVSSQNKVHAIVAENGPFYEVDDRATHLLLLDGKKEVRRVPLNLRGLDLNVVDI